MTYSSTLVSVFLIAGGCTDAFNVVSLPPSKGIRCSTFNSVSTRMPGNVGLFGILDDFEAGASSSSSSTPEDDAQKEVNEVYQKLFDDLVYSGNVEIVITEKLEACTDAGFLLFLGESSTNASDVEESQALNGLMATIKKVQDRVQAEQVAAEQKAEAAAQSKAERQAEIDEQLKVEAATRKVLSAADVMKKALDIDTKDITPSAEASEEDLPDNFMRDAKAVRGLSGFNDKGSMSVGGG